MEQPMNNRRIKGPFLLKLTLLTAILAVASCTKVIDVEIPDSANKIVVEGSIENGSPPIVLLTKSAKFFDEVNINDIASYYVRGAQVSVTGSDGTYTPLTEFCLQDLNLTPQEAQELLLSFGFSQSQIDSGQVPDICVYTVPDIVSFFLTGNCAFKGQSQTSYYLDIVAPPLQPGLDSVRANSTTYIPYAIGLDSLAFREHPNPDYRDSLVSCYAYFSVPDTFGNFIRYWTKRNSEPFYKPLSSSVYDDRLFVGLSIGLPLERGQPDGQEFDINTYTYFRKGDTVSVKWSNIDNKTYDFYYTLENDGGDSPFSSPVKIKTNINNGLGIWAGYGSKYTTAIAPL